MAPIKTSAQTERALRQRLLRSYRDAFPGPPKHLFVGFSGGNDSLALALLLKQAAKAMRTSITLVHIDHRIRPESGEDAVLAGELAARVGLPFKLLTLDDHPQKLHPEMGIEEAARTERFRLLASMVRHPTDAIVLAHHAGDQVETMLLHLLRGAGIDGLAGMRELSEVDTDDDAALDDWDDELDGEDASEFETWQAIVATEGDGSVDIQGGIDLVLEFDDDEDLPSFEDLDDEDYYAFGGPEYVTVWRPFLRETRSDLEAIVAAHKLQPIVDQSNFDVAFKRNEIRHQLIPAIAAVAPDYEERFGDLAEIAREEAEFIQFMADELANQAIADDLSLDRRQLGLPHRALGRRIVRDWLFEFLGEVPSFERVEAVLTLASELLPEVAIEVGRGYLVAMVSNRLICAPAGEIKAKTFEASKLMIPLAGSNARIRIDGSLVQVPARGPGTIKKVKLFEVPENARISIERVNRNEKMPTSKSVWNDWMRDHSIPAWVRDDLQGVAVDGVMRWIPLLDDIPFNDRMARSGGRAITVEAVAGESIT